MADAPELWREVQHRSSGPAQVWETFHELGQRAERTPQCPKDTSHLKTFTEKGVLRGPWIRDHSVKYRCSSSLQSIWGELPSPFTSREDWLEGHNQGRDVNNNPEGVLAPAGVEGSPVTTTLSAATSKAAAASHHTTSADPKLSQTPAVNLTKMSQTALKSLPTQSIPKGTEVGMTTRVPLPPKRKTLWKWTP